MALSPEEVRKVARLARLELAEEEISKYARQLSAILEYVEKLKTLPTDGVEPLAHVLEVRNVFREDRVQESLPVEEVLKNAPQPLQSFFKVPKIQG